MITRFVNNNQTMTVKIDHKPTLIPVLFPFKVKNMDKIGKYSN